MSGRKAGKEDALARVTGRRKRIERGKRGFVWWRKFLFAVFVLMRKEESLKWAAFQEPLNVWSVSWPRRDSSGELTLGGHSDDDCGAWAVKPVHSGTSTPG